jgi:hypothetical protein
MAAALSPQQPLGAPWTAAQSLRDDAADAMASRGGFATSTDVPSALVATDGLPLEQLFGPDRPMRRSLDISIRRLRKQIDGDVGGISAFQSSP